MFIGRLETIKSEMTNKILSEHDESEITIFKFTPNEYENNIYWFNEKEFGMNGRMYDVVKIERQMDNYIIYCFNDFKEELLVSNFKKIIERKSEHRSLVTGNQNLTILQAIPNDLWVLKHFYKKNNYLQIIVENYSSIVSDIQSPPPKVNS